MSLTRYKHMRRFAETPEPSGGASTKGAPIFVVQLHHASHRHYDFRLEHDGVLKSWAVPKGPSFDPGVKRLAMQVEDHPIDYASFEGHIPDGNYGAGEVRVFDHGTWSSDDDIDQQLKKGHLHFALDGDKLQGKWDLIRTGGHSDKPQWLLKKVDDAEAGPFEADDLLGDPADYHLPDEVWHSHRPGTSRRGVGRAKKVKTGEADALAGARKETIDASAFAPELARATLSPPTGDDWIHEPKWDGYRLLAAVADGKARLWSRNGIEWTDRVPHVIDAIEELGARALRLDGELVALGKNGKASSTDFNALQATLTGDGRASLKYVVFDLLHADGLDLSAMPLTDRKKMLHGLLARLDAKGAIVEGEYTVGGDAKALYARYVKAGYEGIVSKRATSPYRAGRGDDWKKLRAREAEELAVVGYTDPRGSRHGIGALLMGRPRKDGGWDYAGRVGTGLGDALLSQLGERLPAMARKTPPVHEDSLVLPRDNGDLRSVHWVTPRLTIEVEHHGRGNGGLLRQPSVKSLRLDKTPADLAVDPQGDRPLDQEKAAKVSR
ncbi:MAG: non-homologous end-joining DNA ligase, partial [Polyangia bacterium]